MADTNSICTLFFLPIAELPNESLFLLISSIVDTKSSLFNEMFINPGPATSTLSNLSIFSNLVLRSSAKFFGLSFSMLAATIHTFEVI